MEREFFFYLQCPVEAPANRRETCASSDDPAALRHSPVRMKAPPAMTYMIEPTIDHSLTIAHNHASVGDVAYGLLAALRRVRWVVDEVGGYTMVSMLDGAIRDRLIIRHLRNARSGADRKS